MHPALITPAQMENKLEPKQEKKTKNCLNTQAQKGGEAEDTWNQEVQVWKTFSCASPLTLMCASLKIHNPPFFWLN